MFANKLSIVWLRVTVLLAFFVFQVHTIDLLVDSLIPPFKHDNNVKLLVDDLIGNSVIASEELDSLGHGGTCNDNPFAG